MSTRGSVKILGKKYYIVSDAYPGFAQTVIGKVLKVNQPKSPAEFINDCNNLAGFKWIDGIAPKNFKWPFEEFTYTIALKSKTYSVEEVKPTPSQQKEHEQMLERHRW